MITSIAGREFEKQVASLYQSLGWSIQRNLVMSGHEIDIYAERNIDGLTLRVAIECKSSDRPLGNADIQEIAGRVAMLRNRGTLDKAIVVAKAGFTASAKSAAAVYHIDCFHYDDLLDSAIDFFPYLLSLTSARTEPNALGSFIDPTLEDKEGRHWPAMGYVEQWLASPKTRHLAILGDAGSGKSMLCKQVASGLAQAALANRLDAPIPILLPLRHFDSTLGIRPAIVDQLKSYGVRVPSVAALDRLLEGGRCVLILDGLDEMAASSRIPTADQAFWGIADVGRTNSKVLLTSRTQFFASQGRETEILEARSDPIAATLSSRPVFDVVYLAPWDHRQIREYIRSADPTNAGEIEFKIRAEYGLDDLASRPVLLQMILMTLPYMASSRGNSAALYKAYVDALIDRDAIRRKMNVSPESIRDILRALALEMILSPVAVMQDGELSVRVQAILKDSSQEQVAETVSVLSALSIMSRDADGNYRFTHKSFAEFLAAEELLRRQPELAVESPREVQIFKEQLLELIDQQEFP